MKVLYTMSILLSVFLCACSSENYSKTDAYKSEKDIIDCIKTNIEDFDSVKDVIVNHPDQYGRNLTIKYSRSKDGIEFTYFRDSATWTGSLTVEELFEGQMISTFMELYECDYLSYVTENSNLHLKFENAGLNSGLLYTEEPDKCCTSIEGCEGWYYFAYPLGH